MIDMLGILQLRVAKCFAQNNGESFDQNDEDNIAAWMEDLDAICPSQPVLIGPVPGVQTNPCCGAVCHCWNQCMMPHIWNDLWATAREQGVIINGVGLQSLKLTNVNLVCASRHKTVCKARHLLLSRFISVNLLCHTCNMSCQFKQSFRFHSDLKDLTIGNCPTHLPLKFSESPARDCGHAQE